VSDRLVSFIFDQSESERLDKFLVECLPEFSRARLQALIRDGRVSVNGQVVQKSGEKLGRQSTVTIHIPPPQPSSLRPEDIPLNIIFENKDLIVVNKPAGMVVHPSAGHDSGTLVHAALSHAPDIEGIGGEQRPGIVHRLDKNTSGLILIAKNDITHRWLQDQFRERQVKKTYLALVDGEPPTPTGRIEAPIGRDQKTRRKMAVTSPLRGREAISEYTIFESFPEHTLLEVCPITGRTHQIRLHMAFLGCPVVGDTIYGKKHPTIPMERYFLHAIQLNVMLKGEKQARTFEAAIPEELTDILERLRQQPLTLLQDEI
jgi:23S rRNA pseudouridine1911/1915/1917 synthase